jgi:hypothetical protein
MALAAAARPLQGTHQLSQKAPGWQLANVSTPSIGSLLCATMGTARKVRMPL